MSAHVSIPLSLEGGEVPLSAPAVMPLVSTFITYLAVNVSDEVQIIGLG